MGGKIITPGTGTRLERLLGEIQGKIASIIPGDVGIAVVLVDRNGNATAGVDEMELSTAIRVLERLEQNGGLNLIITPAQAMRS